jgi:hypothetical protein
MSQRQDIYSVFPGDYNTEQSQRKQPQQTTAGQRSNLKSSGSGHRSKNQGPPPIPTARGSSNPTAIFNLPPKKIIKANANYKAQKLGEITFQKGDFFYVNQNKHCVSNFVRR